MPLTNKMLSKQHDEFAAAQQRRELRQARKEAKEREWKLSQEHRRKKRERKERAADLAQQRRLEDDPDYALRYDRQW